MSAHDTIQNGEERLDPSVLFARVPAGGRRSGHYHARLMRRGRYRFGPAQLTARFPLGIVERGLVFPLPGEILVYPRLGRLSARWMREHFLATDLVERRELRQGAFDDEFHRIREFRWGDNPRAIHWRTSARHNALMVREYHQSRDLNLMVLCDLWLPAAPDDARARAARTGRQRCRHDVRLPHEAEPRFDAARGDRRHGSWSNGTANRGWPTPAR